MWCPSLCSILEKFIGRLQSASFTIWRVTLILVSSIVEAPTHWWATPTRTGMVMVMIGNQLLVLCSTSVMILWSGPLRNRRLSLYQPLKLSIMVLLKLTQGLFQSKNSWVSLGFLSKPRLFFTVTIKVQFGSPIILLHIVRWSMLKFIAIIWDNWFRKRLPFLFIVGLMNRLLISLRSVFWKQSLLSFLLFLGFKKLELWVGVQT